MDISKRREEMGLHSIADASLLERLVSSWTFRFLYSASATEFRMVKIEHTITSVFGSCCADYYVYQWKELVRI